MKNSKTLVAVSAFALAISFTNSAIAQGMSTGAIEISPDKNGIDWYSGTPGNMPMEISLGTPDAGISYRENFNYLRRNNWIYTITEQFQEQAQCDQHTVYVSHGESATAFESFNGDPLLPRIKMGESLSPDFTASGMCYQYMITDTPYFTFRDRDGTEVTYDQTWQAIIPEGGRPTHLGKVVTRPNGEKFTLFYNTQIPPGSTLGAHSRLQAVKSNRGYQIRFEYESDVLNFNGDVTNLSYLPWYRRTGIYIINDSVDYCDPNQLHCSNLTANWPQINIVSSGNFSGLGYHDGRPGKSGSVTATDSSGQTVKYSWVGGATFNNLTTVMERGSPAKEQITYNNYNQYAVTSLGSYYYHGGTYQYDPDQPNYLEDANTDTIVVLERTAPNGGNLSMWVKLLRSEIWRITDELGRVTKFGYDSGRRLKYVVRPEGSISLGNPTSDYTKYDYDSRGNIVQTTVAPKNGSGLPNQVTTSGFDSSCANPKTCNQPIWSKDARGYQTDYTYHSASGGVESVMKPAASPGAARPLTLTTYGQRSAWTKNSAGALVQSPDPIWTISTVTECQTVAGGNSPVCDSAASQTVTTYEYGASGTREALLVKGRAVSSGGTVLRTCYGYDIYNRPISETKPNANLTSCP